MCVYIYLYYLHLGECREYSTTAKLIYEVDDIFFLGFFVEVSNRMWPQRGGEKIGLKSYLDYHLMPRNVLYVGGGGTMGTEFLNS